MFNKKRLGLGMMIAGGIVTVVGAVVTMKSVKEDKCEVENNYDECIHPDKYEDCNECIDEEQCWKHSMEKIENKNIPTEWVPTSTTENIKAISIECEPSEENVIKARISTSTYNPNAEPVAMSQQDLESHGETF